MDCCGIFPYHNQHEQIIIHSHCHSLFSMHKCYSPTGRQLPLPYSTRHFAHCRNTCLVRNGALLGPIQLCRHHTHTPSRNDLTRICQLHRPVATCSSVDCHSRHKGIGRPPLQHKDRQRRRQQNTRTNTRLFRHTDGEISRRLRITAAQRLALRSVSRRHVGK